MKGAVVLFDGTEVGVQEGVSLGKVVTEECEELVRLLVRDEIEAFLKRVSAPKGKVGARW